MKDFYVGHLRDSERVELDLMRDPHSLGVYDHDERSEDERWERAYEEKIMADELAEAHRIESEENERTEREDSYAIEF